MTQSALVKSNTNKWGEIFSKGGPRNHYPHSYVVSWYFKNVYQTTKLLKMKKVLDIGCGTAPDLFLFVGEGFEYHGIDITDKCFSQVMDVAESRKLDVSQIRLGLFTPPLLPYEDSSFDVTVGLESLHFNIGHENMKIMADEVFRVLKKGGSFLFTTINKKHYFVFNEHSRFISDNCLIIDERFPESERVGLHYHIFSGREEIKDYFYKFIEVNIGEYFLDTCDNKPDAYYVIFGKK